MEFEEAKTYFYACAIIAGCVGGVVRQIRDMGVARWGIVISGIFQGGVFGGGSVGLWLGHRPDATAGPYYYLAVALFVGFFSLEIYAHTLHSSTWILDNLAKTLGIHAPQKKPGSKNG